MNNISTIIFDLGGIIVNLDKEVSLNNFAKIGLNLDKQIGNSVQNGIFHDLELGKIDVETFCDKLNSISTSEMKPLSSNAIIDAWNSMLTNIPIERLEKIEELRNHYQVYLLSNTNPIHWQYCCDKLVTRNSLSFRDYFNDIFLSFQVGISKPDPKIFQYVIEKSGVVPENTLFIDDSQANCEAAAKLGFHTYCSGTNGEWILLFDQDANYNQA